MASQIKAALTILTVIAMTLLASPAPAHAGTVEQGRIVEVWDFTFQPDCFEEEVAVYGRTLIRWTVGWDASDGWHQTTTFAAQGISGTGLTSGARYPVALASTSAVSDGDYYSDEGRLVWTSTSHYKILSPASGPLLLSTSTNHYTFTPDGGLVVTWSDFSWECISN